MNNMTAIGYCRKSSESEDRQTMSLDAQEFELQKIAEREGIQLTQTYRESMSAKTFGRPFFNEMVQKISNGEADTIVCWKSDRLSRNPTDSAILQTLLQQGLLKSIITFDRTYRSTDNVLVFGIEQLMANQYIIELSANVKRGNREKLRRGEWPNHAPYGYRNDKNTKTLKLVPAQAEIVRKIFQMYATGRYSLKQISKEVGLPKSTVGNISGRTFYYGLMERDGEFYPGKHKPIISKELFEKVQRIKNEVTVYSRPKNLFFPLRGFMKCAECGCQLTATLKKGKYEYYYCTNGKGFCTQYKKYLTSTQADSLFIETFLKIKFDEELIEIMYEAARQRLENGQYDSQKILDSISNELHQTKAKERKLLHTFTSGLIDENLYAEEARKLTEEKKELEAKFKNYTHNANTRLNTLELTRQIFLDSNRAVSEFKNSKPEKKRRMVENLLWNLEVKDKNVANYSFKSRYQVLANAPKNGDLTTMLPDKDSNLDSWCQKPESYH